MPKNKSPKIKETEIAISVKGVSKTFRIPHEKISSVKGAVLGAFRNKSYEEFKALDDVSFEVKKGEFFGIIGRNGSGKSTLLKVLAKIYQADKGSVEINGMISPFLELGIGFNPELSGRDNVYLNATVLGMTKKQIDEKFDDIVKFSELERFIDQKLKNYSSGMSVRLAFSVSIHANRDILLMDEVLAVGDSNFQSKCLTEFNRYKKDGKTVVLVTHDVGTVQRYCDRAMLLRNGSIMKIGNAEDVGNEYIYENMSDEEKRLFDEESSKIDVAERNLKNMKGKELEVEKKRIAEERVRREEERKNKVAEITNVEFLDKDGEVKNVFQTGDDLSVRIYFKLNRKLEEFNFGFGLYDDRNQYIFGINTIIDEIDTNKYIERGYIQIDFKCLLLKTEKYYIKASMVKDNFNSLYDFLERSCYFSVQSVNKNEGIVDMDYAWK